MLTSFANFEITPAPSVPEAWGLREGRAVGILVAPFYHWTPFCFIWMENEKVFQETVGSWRRTLTTWVRCAWAKALDGPGPESQLCLLLLAR